jgi:hypothetical protein
VSARRKNAPLTPCEPFRVRCKDGNRDHLEAGAEYMVAETIWILGQELYGLQGHWPGHLFGAYRFERITEQPDGALYGPGDGRSGLHRPR